MVGMFIVESESRGQRYNRDLAQKKTARFHNCFGLSGFKSRAFIVPVSHAWRTLEIYSTREKTGTSHLKIMSNVSFSLYVTV